MRDDDYFDDAPFVALKIMACGFGILLIFGFCIGLMGKFFNPADSANCQCKCEKIIDLSRY